MCQFIPMDRLQQDRLSGLLKELRGEVSQRQYAKRLGVSYSALRSWEDLESVPGLQKLEVIASFKGWTLEQLLDYLRGQELDDGVTFDHLADLASRLPDSKRLKLAKLLLASVE